MKSIIRTISVILALVMASLMPVQAFAAADSASYISEIVTVTAGSFSEAKEKLEAAGYKAVGNGNLNATLTTGVYLGYKETDDRNDAVTDIAGMNMTGKFSYSDYKQIMESYREDIEATVENFECSIEEFQLNFGAETKNASLAWTALNMYKDDDSGKLMGDYFLDYDFSDEAKESMTDTLMQANSDVVVALIKILTFAADPDDTTFIERMVKTGPDGVSERYAKAYQTTAQAQKAMAKEYGSDAQTLYENWDVFYNVLLSVEKELIKSDSSGDITVSDGIYDVEAADLSYVEDVPENVRDYMEAYLTLGSKAAAMSNANDVVLYSLLENTAFGEGTLLDYFKRPSSDVELSELYVLVDSLSEAQRSELEYVGIYDILTSAFSDVEADENADGALLEQAEENTNDYTELAQSFEPVSIFENVDRSIFEDGVAFTSSAVNHEALSGRSWLDRLCGVVSPSSDYWTPLTVVSWISTAVLGTVCLTSRCVFAYEGKVYNTAKEVFEHSDIKAEYDEVFEAFKNNLIERNQTYDEDIVYDIILDREESLARNYKAAEENLAAVKTRTEKVQSSMAMVHCVSFLLLIVALAIDVWTLIDYIISDDAPTEESVPHHIMATADTAYGEDYVYYGAVKTLDGKAADTNNHEADAATGWLVLYTTKDANAGEPICSDNLRVKTGNSNLGETASFAHLFNETAALNLTSEIYTGTPDSVSGTYIVFDREGISAAASAISGGVAALIAAAGLALGAVAGSVITSAVKKKKADK